MPNCYLLGTDCISYKPLIESVGGWRVEVAHSKAVLEVKPKIEKADLIFCNLAQLPLEAMLQLSLSVALKKRFFFVVSRTTMRKIKEYIDIEREINEDNVLFLEDVHSEKVSTRKKVTDHLVRIRNAIRTKRIIAAVTASLTLLTLLAVCSFRLGSDYFNLRCCWCDLLDG